MTERHRDDDDRGSRSRSRDDDRGSSRDRDERGSRDRGSDRDSERGSRDRDREERGGSRDRGSSRSSYEYTARSPESVRERASKGANDYDQILKSGVKMWKPNDGDNRVRLVPPTWKKADHFGLDIYVHYGVGPDRQSYLCLTKMLDKPDPISEERDRFKRDMDPEDEKDKKYLSDLDAKRRVLVYLIDRDNEKEGVQAWAMPWTIDRDIVLVTQDKQSGEVLPIDHPEDGYDVEFTKTGKDARTKYTGISIARRSSPLGKREWMDYAIENPLPDQLQYFDYEHIAKAFGAKGDHKERDRHDDDGGRRGQPDHDDDKRRERDGDRGGRDREERGSSRDRNEDPELTWESVHDMRPRELEDLIEDKRLKINPKEAKDDEDLADWICDELKLKKAEERSTRRVADEDPDDKLRKMRERRGD